MPDYTTYISPFSWRYGSPAMRAIWSEENKRLTWRRIWIALAEIQAEYNLINPAQLADLQKHAAEVNIPRALEIEAMLRHDLVAELRVFTEQCPVGGGCLHLGATSMDIEDNADALRIKESLQLLIGSLSSLLEILAGLIETHADTTLIAFTHLQPAEPSTLGYRLAFYGQDLLRDYENLVDVTTRTKGKGFKGSVGTSASYADLIGHKNLDEFERKLSRKLQLPFFTVTSQVSPRKQEFELISTLASLGASLSKAAMDIRLLQSPPIGELAEPFASTQVGSSAMPFKRNPILSEKINSLARELAGMPRLAWDNAALSMLERSLDDSANRRSMLPESFLISDELLQTAREIFVDLRVDEAAMQRNLAIHGAFAGLERVLIALVKKGANRQEMLHRLRDHAMEAWQRVQREGINPIEAILCKDEILLSRVTVDEIHSLMDSRHHIGNAPLRAKRMAETIRKTIHR